ncbi:MAG: gamma-glutamyltransferase [Opitutales bacterium]|jgi:gamma-glutamyltranspeptidase/glutathione hydrolase
MADRVTGRGFATRSEVLGGNGMVASSQPLATQAGLDILKAGGNAVDAAIGVNACLGLMEPTGCGVGGDVFVLAWDAASGRLHGLNGSGRSASSSSLEAMRSALAKAGEEKIPTRGPLSVTVPGCVDGWFELHSRFGRQPMESILAPAIHYAEEGFPVSQVIAYYWDLSMRTRSPYPGFLDTFSVDGKRAPREREIWRNSDLASTYRLLAKEGRDHFYQGKMARMMADFLEQNGSFLRYGDFAEHSSTWVDPISTNYRGYDVWELPPNGQGLAVLQMLNILEGYNFRNIDFGCPDHLHLLIEAKKLAFADRARLYADPEFFKTPVAQLLDKDYARQQRARIAPDRAARMIIPDPSILKKGDTVYLCAADGDGNMVSFIQSNYHGIGSGMCPPKLGFGFQTRGSAFALQKGHPNAYEPGKRPFHTIIPGFMTRDGAPLCAFGVMGGDTQPQAQVQVVMNMVDFGMNLQEAGDAPRVVHSGDSDPTGAIMSDGGTVAMESGFPEESIPQLAFKGHKIDPERRQFGGYQAIWRDPETGVLSGASESRKDGQAAGY